MRNCNDFAVTHIEIKDEKTGRKVFYSIDTMAEYVEKHRAK